VSVETIYKAFGGKPGLVRAIYERGLTGREPIPAFQRADAMRERETDPRTIMHNWGDLTSEVSSIVSPIARLVRAAAASDPDMAALLKAANDTREERARHHARFLKQRGYLREDVTLGQATDILWTCTSDELYDLLVLQRAGPCRASHGSSATS
jgi:AcrR family transcriptional regulator